MVGRTCAWRRSVSTRRVPLGPKFASFEMGEAFLFALIPDETIRYVVVGEPLRLHERIRRGRAKESPAASLEVLGKRRGPFGKGRDLSIGLSLIHI